MINRICVFIFVILSSFIFSQQNKIVFEFNSQENYSKVYLSGSFQNWKPNDEKWLMKKIDNKFIFETSYLKDGTYSFKFCPEGDWNIKDMEKVKDGINVYRNGIKMPVSFTDDGFGGKNAKVVISDNKSEDGALVKVNTNIIRIEYSPKNTYNEVYIAGSFQGWKPNDSSWKMNKKNNRFILDNIALENGVYNFKLCPEGDWNIKDMEKEKDFITLYVNNKKISLTFVDDGFGGKNAKFEIR